MVSRVAKESPEYFDEIGMSRHELEAHLTHNMCLPYSKYFARIKRDTTAAIVEKKFLTDDIRKLANGGDRFHPYLWAIPAKNLLETILI